MNTNNISDSEIIDALNRRIRAIEESLCDAADCGFVHDCRDVAKRLKEARDILREIFYFGD